VEHSGSGFTADALVHDEEHRGLDATGAWLPGNPTPNPCFF